MSTFKTKMAEPTPQELFGEHFVQNLTTATFTKADFPTLTADAANRAEQLWVAIFLKCASQLTEERQAANPEQSITIAKSFTPESLVSRNNKQYRQLQFVVNFQKEELALDLDPNDY